MKSLQRRRFGRQLTPHGIKIITFENRKGNSRIMPKISLQFNNKAYELSYSADKETIFFCSCGGE